MPHIQIRNVPDHVHLILKRQAGAAGQSLQEYMLDLVTRMSEKPTWDEFIEMRRHQRGGRIDMEDMLRGIHEDRDSH
jgi:preprotein translocase subunit Sss1